MTCINKTHTTVLGLNTTSIFIWNPIILKLFAKIIWCNGYQFMCAMNYLIFNNILKTCTFWEPTRDQSPSLCTTILNFWNSKLITSQVCNILCRLLNHPTLVMKNSRVQCSYEVKKFHQKMSLLNSFSHVNWIMGTLIPI